MISIGESVFKALESLNVPVRHSHLPENMVLPCVTWHESGNRQASQADGREYLSEVEYAVDIWSYSTEMNAQLLCAADAALAAIGLKRTYSAELFETDTRLHHRAARYSGWVDLQKNVWQG